MPNTPPDKYRHGYGEKAYEHAKTGFHGGPVENWTLETDAVNQKRHDEYETRYKVFKGQHALQTVKELLGGKTSKRFTFEKGDTLYPALKDYFGMNDHTAFFTMMKMLECGVNVDLWKECDWIELRDGKLIVGKPPNETEVPLDLKPRGKKKKKKKKETTEERPREEMPMEEEHPRDRSLEPTTGVILKTEPRKGREAEKPAEKSTWKQYYDQALKQSDSPSVQTNTCLLAISELQKSPIPDAMGYTSILPVLAKAVNNGFEKSQDSITSMIDRRRGVGKKIETRGENEAVIDPEFIFIDEDRRVIVEKYYDYTIGGDLEGQGRAFLYEPKDAWVWGNAAMITLDGVKRYLISPEGQTYFVDPIDGALTLKMPEDSMKEALEKAGAMPASVTFKHVARDTKNKYAGGYNFFKGNNQLGNFYFGSGKFCYRYVGVEVIRTSSWDEFVTQFRKEFGTTTVPAPFPGSTEEAAAMPDERPEWMKIIVEARAMTDNPTAQKEEALKAYDLLQRTSPGNFKGRKQILEVLGFAVNKEWAKEQGHGKSGPMNAVGKQIELRGTNTAVLHADYLWVDLDRKVIAEKYYNYTILGDLEENGRAFEYYPNNDLVWGNAAYIYVDGNPYLLNTPEGQQYFIDPIDGKLTLTKPEESMKNALEKEGVISAGITLQQVTRDNATRRTGGFDVFKGDKYVGKFLFGNGEFQLVAVGYIFFKTAFWSDFLGKFKEEVAK